MAFYVYRDGMTVKIREGDSITAQSLYDEFGGENMGSPAPYETMDQAKLYSQKWQKKEDAYPGCQPPYSIEKD
jgi:hypothetical protein